LRAQKDLPFSHERGAVKFQIPSIDDYEVVALS
jgi:hypothetical protein